MKSIQLIDDYLLDSSSVAYERKQLNDILNGIMGKVLWANKSPNNDFGSQTITFVNNNYDTFEIVYKSATGNTPMFTQKIYANVTNPQVQLIRGNSSSTNLSVRTATLTSATTIQFGDAYFAGNIGNNNSIPLYVIGYKTGLF